MPRWQWWRHAGTRLEIMKKSSYPPPHILHFTTKLSDFLIVEWSPGSTVRVELLSVALVYYVGLGWAALENDLFCMISFHFIMFCWFLSKLIDICRVYVCMHVCPGAVSIGSTTSTTHSRKKAAETHSNLPAHVTQWWRQQWHEYANLLHLFMCRKSLSPTACIDDLSIGAAAPYRVRRLVHKEGSPIVIGYILLTQLPFYGKASAVPQRHKTPFDWICVWHIFSNTATTMNTRCSYRCHEGSIIAMRALRMMVLLLLYFILSLQWC